MNRPLSFKIMVFLALVQGVGGLLRAYNWVQIGVDLFGQGILLPVVGLAAVMRGLFISVVALLYLLFVLGALLGRRWGAWVCFSAVAINLMLVLNGMVRGASPMQATTWAVIPIILVFYLVSQSGRNTLSGGSASR